MSAAYSNYNLASISSECYPDTFTPNKVSYAHTYGGVETPDITDEMLVAAGSKKMLTIAAYTSCTLVVQCLLQQAHNAAAKETGCMKGLQTVGIEIGFLATTFLLAPVELVARSVQALGMFVFGALHIATLWITSNDFDDDAEKAFENYFIEPIIGVMVTAMNTPQAAVSAFYTHIAHSNEEISNRGQAACFLLCENPKVENK